MTSYPSAQPNDLRTGSVSVCLDRADVALIIDALLQAEMTLPLIDDRYQAMKVVESLRSRQLALANLLEDLIADDTREHN